MEPWSEVRTTVKEGKLSCERDISFCVYRVYVLKRAEGLKKSGRGGWVVVVVGLWRETERATKRYDRILILYTVLFLGRRGPDRREPITETGN